MQDKTVVINIR